MSLYNFHPKKAVLLDGYYLLRKVHPDLNIHNPEIAEFVMKEILKQVNFKPVFPGKQNPEGAWFSMENDSSSWYWSRIHDALKGKNYALNALLPNGRIIRDLHKVDIVSYFKDEEGIPYVHSSDGMFFCMIPSLDERFLKFYERNDYELTDEEKANMVKDYSMPVVHEDGTYSYDTF